MSLLIAFCDVFSELKVTIRVQNVLDTERIFAIFCCIVWVCSPERIKITYQCFLRQKMSSKSKDWTVYCCVLPPKEMMRRLDHRNDTDLRENSPSIHGDRVSMLSGAKEHMNWTLKKTWPWTKSGIHWMAIKLRDAVKNTWHFFRFMWKMWRLVKQRFFIRTIRIGLVRLFNRYCVSFRKLFFICSWIRHPQFKMLLGQRCIDFKITRAKK